MYFRNKEMCILNGLIYSTLRGKVIRIFFYLAEDFGRVRLNERWPFILIHAMHVCGGT